LSSFSLLLSCLCFLDVHYVGTLKTGYPRIQALSQGKEQGVYPRAATQAVALGLASLLRWASALPCVLRLQLSLPSPGQLRGHHMSCGSSSRCPARGSSGATMCPAALAPTAQPGAAPGPPRVLRHSPVLPSPGQLGGPPRVLRPQLPLPSPGPPRVPWRPNGQRAVKVNRYPLSVAIMVTLRGVCTSSEAPHDKRTPCACKTCGQGRLQGCNGAALTRSPYTADRYSAG
jgi:hypothetical protein